MREEVALKINLPESRVQVRRPTNTPNMLRTTSFTFGPVQTSAPTGTLSHFPKFGIVVKRRNKKNKVKKPSLRTRHQYTDLITVTRYKCMVEMLFLLLLPPLGFAAPLVLMFVGTVALIGPSLGSLLLEHLDSNLNRLTRHNSADQSSSVLRPVDGTRFLAGCTLWCGV